MINPDIARDFITSQGYRVFYYDGKLRNSPTNLRHILRELGAGYYAAKDATSPVYLLSEAVSHPESELNQVAFYHVVADLLRGKGILFISDANGHSYQTPGNFFTKGRTVGPFMDATEAIEDAAIGANLLTPEAVLAPLDLANELMNLELAMKAMMEWVHTLRNNL